MKTVLLTFDLEEFDLPREFNQEISEDEMYNVSEKGLRAVKKLLEKHSLKVTFFTTATFAKKYPLIVKELAKEHEIACHSYCHSDNCIEDISQANLAKKEIEKIIGKKINGFRAPRFEIRDIHRLSEFGFEYDSSTHPTIAPGKYFNIHQKRKLHKIGNITEIPLSTLPLIPFLRAPINWYMLRHFPSLYYKLFTGINFAFSDYLMLILHPWEFTEINHHNIPKEFKKNSGDYVTEKLERYIQFCKKKDYKFETVSGFLGL